MPVVAWGHELVEWALDELINDFDLFRPLALCRVQFFSDRHQTW